MIDYLESMKNTFKLKLHLMFSSNVYVWQVKYSKNIRKTQYKTKSICQHAISVNQQINKHFQIMKRWPSSCVKKFYLSSNIFYFLKKNIVKTRILSTSMWPDSLNTWILGNKHTKQIYQTGWNGSDLHDAFCDIAWLSVKTSTYQERCSYFLSYEIKQPGIAAPLQGCYFKACNSPHHFFAMFFST